MCLLDWFTRPFSPCVRWYSPKRDATSTPPLNLGLGFPVRTKPEPRWMPRSLGPQLHAVVYTLSQTGSDGRSLRAPVRTGAGGGWASLEERSRVTQVCEEELTLAKERTSSAQLGHIFRVSPVHQENLYSSVVSLSAFPNLPPLHH